MAEGIGKVNYNATLYSFLKKFNVADDKAQKIAEDGTIDKDEIKDLVETSKAISYPLIQLIDRNMVDKGRSDEQITDEQITEDEVKKFDQTVGKYSKAFDISEDKAIELYKNAPAFEMVDLDKVIETAEGLKKGALGIEIAANTSFGKLSSKIDPKFESVLKEKFAQLRGISVNDVKFDTYIYWKKEKNEAEAKESADKMCKFLAALPLISRLDKETQKEVFGISKALPRFEGEINEENILSYLKREPENTPAQPQQVTETKKEEEKKAEEKPQPLPEIKKVKKEETDISLVNKAASELAKLSKPGANTKVLLSGIKEAINKMDPATYEAFQRKLTSGKLMGKSQKEAIDLLEKAIKG